MAIKMEEERNSIPIFLFLWIIHRENTVKKLWNFVFCVMFHDNDINFIWFYIHNDGWKYKKLEVEN